jgi:peptidoglycan/LPS O-acetylase OafA/YrhL
MRIVPNLVAVILFCTFILPSAGTGPLWNQVVKQNYDICKSTWWRNLLFIQNYFGAENMCIIETHHLGTDAQLFAFSPLLVYMVWKWPRTGLSVLTGLAAISTALRYNATVSSHLSYYFHFGISFRELCRTFDLLYLLPAHRMTVYIMGIALGIVFRYCGRDFRLKRMHLTAGWIAALICFYMSIISPAHMASRYYVYNTSDAASYAAFVPIYWCLFLAWVIFVSYIGQAGLLNRMLSWKGFLVTTRLSYSLYLTQFHTFFYFVGKNRSINSFNMFQFVDVPEIALLVAASLLLSVLVELPFQNIGNILLKRTKNVN